MKRLLTLVLMVAAVVMAAPAFAAVGSSPHDYLASTYGRCGICHVPHAAGGAARLWRVAPTGGLTGWAGSNVGKLCYGCHGNGYLFGGTVTGNAFGGIVPHTWASTAGPFADTSHGRSVSTLTGALTGTTAGGQPYLSTGTMECTSCHNVHFEGTFAATNGNRPFLRQVSAGATYASLSDYCATCHNDRLNSNTLGTSNTTGNHPVNIAYASAGGGAYFVPVASMNAALKRVVPLDAWSLGGKFNNPTVAPADGTSTIGCQTCHAIHNPGTNANANNDTGTHLLAINNVDTNAALCEGCHGNPTGNTSRPNSGATMQVGAAIGDHPIDCAITTADGGPTIDRWFATSGDTTRAERHQVTSNDWPRGTGGNIICTSCHSAHRARSARKLTRANWLNSVDTSGTVPWCAACHSDPSPLGHHTHKYNTGAGFASTVQSALDCVSCHGGNSGGIADGGAGSLAHNGFTFNANFANGVTINNASQLCNTCHLGETGPVVEQYGTGKGANDPTGGVAIPALPADHLGVVAAGESGTTRLAHKSHYLGTFADAAGNSIQTKKTSWGAFNGFSKYGAATDTHGGSSDTTGTTVVCESCHSVLHNAGTGTGATHDSGYMVNLLLQNYQDDGHGTVGGTANTAIGSGFCVACHNQTNVGSAVGPVADSVVEGASAKNVVPMGTHPMTGWSITRAQDAGRTPTTLVTGSGTYAAAIGAPNAGSYPAVDKMDCDSCHRPHDAPPNSVYSQTRAGGSANARPVILEYQQNAGEWSDLCQQCHAM